jgi:hypothetical protein
VDLAARRLERAQRGYQAVLDRAPHYDEARLGLGVALALEAETHGDPAQARARRLRALAQFAAVREMDSLYAHGLYDRAVLLSRVRRPREAGRWGAVYLARDSTSPWAERLRQDLGMAAP